MDPISLLSSTGRLLSHRRAEDLYCDNCLGRISGSAVQWSGQNFCGTDCKRKAKDRIYDLIYSRGK